MNVDEVVAALGLVPHPEGGHYRETYRDAASTAIYYVLKAGELSHWHRVDAVEIWNWYAGAPLKIAIAELEGVPPKEHLLGSNVLAGARPQVVVPANAWQSARTLGDWTLVGCTVAPAFEYSGFELAPEGWEPELGKERKSEAG